MRVSIICVGNDYHGDDGFGPAVAAYLRDRYMLPSEVEVISHMEYGRALVGDLMACEASVVVGAFDDATAPVGTLVTFGPQDVDQVAGMTSTLDMSFADVLNLSHALGIDCSQMRCFGAQIDRERGLSGTGLSDALAASIAPCARAIVKHLSDAFWHKAVDCWAMTSDSRALVDDPAAYARSVLAAIGESEQADAVLASLDGAPAPDYEVDRLIAQVLEGRLAA